MSRYMIGVIEMAEMSMNLFERHALEGEIYETLEMKPINYKL